MEKYSAEKYCPLCENLKSIIDFHHDWSRGDGLKWACAECLKRKREKKTEEIIKWKSYEELKRLGFEIPLGDRKGKQILVEKTLLAKAINKKVFGTWSWSKDKEDLQQIAWVKIAYSTSIDTDELYRAGCRAIRDDDVFHYAYYYDELGTEKEGGFEIFESIQLEKATGQVMPKKSQDGETYGYEDDD